MTGPKLRRVDILPYGKDRFILKDPLGISPNALILDRESLMIAILMDGTRDVRGIQEEMARRTGLLIFEERVKEVMEVLRENLYLEDDNVIAKLKEIRDNFKAQRVREPAHSGTVYPAEKEQLINYIKGIIEYNTKKNYSALIVPHIDLARGRRTYGKGFGALGDTVPELIVIFGTSHYADTDSPFILTYKDFLTPLGIARTDVESVRFIIDRSGVDWTEGEFAHRTEHSIEFPLLFLQFLFGNVVIIPVLVNSFHNYILNGQEPSSDERVKGFITALRDVIGDRKTLFVCGADLSHMGPRFGDPEPLGISDIERIRAFDSSFLDKVIRGDPLAVFNEVRETGDCTRICGFPPIYTMLHVIGGLKGELIDYDYHYSTHDYSLVSFASIGFESG